APRFWKAGLTDDERAAGVAQLATDMAEMHRIRLARGWTHARMYSGLYPEMVQAFGALGLALQPDTEETLEPRFGINLLRLVADAVRAQVTQNDIKASFLTEGAPIDAQRKAKLLEEFVEGCFYETDFRTLAPAVLLDACIFGTGALKIWGDSTREELVAERVL